jgi:AraC family transcriptional regulator of arabinose operon
MPDPRLTTPHVRAAPIACNEFREGRGYTNWRPQGSGDWLLIYTLAGVGSVVTSGRTLRLGPGGAVLFAPGARQDYSTDPDAGLWHLRWAHFVPRPSSRPWLMWPEIAPRIGCVQLDGPAAESVGEALGRMLLAHRLGGPLGTDLAMNALEEALIRCAGSATPESRPAPDPRMQRAVRYLALNMAEPFRIENVAAHCGLSPSRFSHLFRESLGTTPQQFSEKLRLESAQQLLRQTNLTIAEIAAEVGYADPLYFSRRFRRAFGHAPSEAGRR